MTHSASPESQQQVAKQSAQYKNPILLVSALTLVSYIKLSFFIGARR